MHYQEACRECQQRMSHDQTPIPSNLIVSISSRMQYEGKIYPKNKVQKIYINQLGFL